MYSAVTIAAFGFLCSIFFGLFAARIFFFEGRKPDYNEKTKPGWPWLIFQFWLNFSCSAVGWVIVIYLLNRLRRDPSQFSLKLDDAVPLVVALLGITGLLPRTLVLGKIPWKD